MDCIAKLQNKVDHQHICIVKDRGCTTLSNKYTPINLACQYHLLHNSNLFI